MSERLPSSSRAPSEDRTLDATFPGDDPRSAKTADLDLQRVENAVAHRLFGAPLEPVKVGRYVVIGRIGAGGLGVVYAAYDPQLDRKVAIKLVRTDGLAEAAVQVRQERLLKEAHAIAKLSHPNVVAVHDAGTSGDEVFIAMEFVQGVSLREWCKGHEGNWRDVLAMFVQAGRGLQAAHAAGLVHRDFKPDNVLVGKDGRARVLDFGLARPVASSGFEIVAGPAGRDEAQATMPDGGPSHSQAIAGTPGYMAPEQYAGSTSDARTDQFAFAVALYEAIHGSRPFVGDTGPELAYNVLHGILRPRVDDLRAPAWLHRAIMRGLAVDPAARYPSMDAFITAISADPSRRHRRFAAAGAAVLLVAVAGWTTLAAMAAREPCTGLDGPAAATWNDGRKDAIRQAFAATEVPYAAPTVARVIAMLDGFADRWGTQRIDACEDALVRGEQSAELMDLRIACLDRALVEYRRSIDELVHADQGMVERAISAVEALPNLDRCADVVRLRSGPEPPADAEQARQVEVVRAELAEMTALMHAGREAVAMERILDLRQQARVLDYGPLSAEVLLILGRLQQRSGDPKSAEPTLEEAAWSAEASRHDHAAAEAKSELVWVVGRMLGRIEDGLRWGRHAEAARDRLPYRDGALDGDIDNHIATVLTESGRHREAKERYVRAIEQSRAVHGPDSVAVASLIHNLGVVVSNLGQHEESLRLHEDSLSVLERDLGPLHPATASARDAYAVQLAHRGRFEEALASHQDALSTLEAVRGPHHTELIGVLNGLGNAEERLGRYDDALGRYRRALTIVQGSLGSPHFAEGALYTNIGNVHSRLGQIVDALAAYARAETIWVATIGAEHPLLANVHVGMADALLAKRDARGALARLQQAEATCRETCTPMVRGQLLSATARARYALGARADEIEGTIADAREALTAAEDAGRELADLERWCKENLAAR